MSILVVVFSRYSSVGFHVSPDSSRFLRCISFVVIIIIIIIIIMWL